MSREPWFFDEQKIFGSVCPDCGGPIYRYCPGCGADMQGNQHVMVKRPGNNMPNPLTVCVDCAKDMQAITELVVRMREALNQPCA